MLKLILLLALTTGLASAAEPFSCKIDKFHGHVTLQTSETVKGLAIAFGAYLGKETFDEPYKVRKKCEALARKLNRKVPAGKKVWTNIGCLEEGREYEQLNLKISDGKQDLTFSPILESGASERLKDLVYRFEYAEGCEGL